MLKEQEQFYEKLYCQSSDCNKYDFEAFVEDLELPKISDEDKQSLEKDIQMHELKKVIKSLKVNKVSGIDGLPNDLTSIFLKR